MKSVDQIALLVCGEKMSIDDKNDPNSSCYVYPGDSLCHNQKYILSYNFLLLQNL